ncbi:MAG: lipoyl synthase [Planctomycetota bacterium]
MFVPLDVHAASTPAPGSNPAPVDSASARPVFPPWLRKRWPAQYDPGVRDILRTERLNTVCHSAQCPNLGECWHAGTATFMILGNTCTRSCSYCDIQIGRAEPVENDEPERVARAVREMNLQYVVLTSVARDDLKDGGAGHWAAVVAAIRAACTAKIEVLTTDFSGHRELLETVLKTRPEVFNHNIEAAPEIFKKVRRQFNYSKSLRVLATAKEIAAELGFRLVTKSGFMVGMGESEADVRGVIDDLRAHGVDLLTVGQYLQPRRDNGLPVARYVTPEEFAGYEAYAREKGFAAAACGPFVRSSYRADELYAQASAAGADAISGAASA